MATSEDANLVMQIVRWSTDMGLDEAMLEIFSDGYDPNDVSSPICLDGYRTARWKASPLGDPTQIGNGLGALPTDY